MSILRADHLQDHGAIFVLFIQAIIMVVSRCGKLADENTQLDLEM